MGGMNGTRWVSPAFVATCGPGAHVVSVGVVHMDLRCLVARARRQKSVSAAKGAAILRSSSIMTVDAMLSMSWISAPILAYTVAHAEERWPYTRRSVLSSAPSNTARAIHRGNQKLI